MRHPARPVKRARSMTSLARWAPQSRRRSNAHRVVEATLPMATLPPVVAHVVFRFGVGGLENGLVNFINHVPHDLCRHAIVALTEVSEDFRARVIRRDVQFYELRKRPGHLWRYFPMLVRLFREIAPAIVHTRNLAALEATFPAWLAGVPVRIHGEHGRDVGDFDGSNVKYQRVRKMYSPFVQRCIALSKDLEHYLVKRVGIDAGRMLQLYKRV